MEENTAKVERLYSAHPLPPQSKTGIRVFVVQPTRPDDEAHLIRGDLQVVDLGSSPAPQFNALSYVWGVDQKFRAVDCGGTSLRVTQNCLDALLHLRKGLDSFGMWIDAVTMHSPKRRGRKDSEVAVHAPDLHRGSHDLCLVRYWH